VLARAGHAPQSVCEIPAPHIHYYEVRVLKSGCTVCLKLLGVLFKNVKVITNLYVYFSETGHVPSTIYLSIYLRA
jgi:hypothetical protein